MQFIMAKPNMVDGVLVFVKCNISEAITDVSKHMRDQQAKTKAKHS
jgi:hypothetical protein